MKTIVNVLLIALTLMFFYGCETEPEDQTQDDQTQEDQVPDETAQELLQGVQHFKQSTIRIERDMTLYFDPYQFSGSPHDADIIFITHSHSDHFSSTDIAKVKNDNTLIVVPQSMEQSARDLGFSTVKTVAPGGEYTINGLQVETTYAYNDTGFRRHPERNNWVGYIVTINDIRYYVCGDTNFVDELQDVRADVAFLNVGGGSSMDAEEAAEAAASIQPQVAVPIHYGVTSGSAENAETFLDLLDDSIQGQIYSDDGELL